MNINFKLSWAGVYRVFRVADQLIKIGGELTDFDINTYRHLYSQCDNEQRKHLEDNFRYITGIIFDSIYN
jgi:hypothetical protein